MFLSIPVFFIAVFKPRLLRYPYNVWIKLGDFLGWINSRIILGLVFILVLQPIAFFMKIFGYNPLNKKLTSKKFYRENNQNSKTNLERIF